MVPDKAACRRPLGNCCCSTSESADPAAIEYRADLERQSPGQSGRAAIAKSPAQLWQDFDDVVIDSRSLLGVLMVNASCR
ncbi:hypothetical protein ACXX9E_28770 [Pseudomonas sp. GNP014]